MSELKNRDDELLANATPIEIEEVEEQSLEPIDLAEESDRLETGAGASASKIRTFAENKQSYHHQWQRQPTKTGNGATHVKTFVCKLRLDAMDHLDDMINEWLDAHPECEVKFVTTTTGELKGKITEPALFVNIWV